MSGDGGGGVEVDAGGTGAVSAAGDVGSGQVEVAAWSGWRAGHLGAAHDGRGAAAAWRSAGRAAGIAAARCDSKR